LRSPGHSAAAAAVVVIAAAAIAAAAASIAASAAAEEYNNEDEYPDTAVIVASAEHSVLPFSALKIVLLGPPGAAADADAVNAVYTRAFLQLVP